MIAGFASIWLIALPAWCSETHRVGDVQAQDERRPSSIRPELTSHRATCRPGGMRHRAANCAAKTVLSVHLGSSTHTGTVAGSAEGCAGVRVDESPRRGWACR